VFYLYLKDWSFFFSLQLSSLFFSHLDLGGEVELQESLSLDDPDPGGAIHESRGWDPDSGTRSSGSPHPEADDGLIPYEEQKIGRSNQGNSNPDPENGLNLANGIENLSGGPLAVIQCEIQKATDKTERECRIQNPEDDTDKEYNVGNREEVTRKHGKERDPHLFELNGTRNRHTR
jgi:hypothetical protein